MSIIKSIKARQILDSRGNPTVECDVFTEKGVFRSSVPSGASAGVHEAIELRDGDKKFYNGKSVLKAVENVNKVIAPKLKGMNIFEQQNIDKTMIELDGTENKGKLGANAILAVSMAVARAAAFEEEVSLYEYVGKLSKNRDFVLPMPMLNIINGGKHAGMENDIQEHMIIPVGAKSFSDALRYSVEIYHLMHSMLKKKFGSRATLIADEGGFAPPFNSLEERLNFILEVIEEAGYKKEIKLALDSASSEFFSDGKYTIGEKTYSSEELIDFYEEIVKTYPIISLEDGMAEDDWEGWVNLTKKLGKKIQVVGDDLLVTNPDRIKEAIKKKAVNSVLIKLNQIGTLTETIEAVQLTQKQGWTTVISHRSGETEDSFIADLAVGLVAGQIKTGAPARSDRNSKYNQLIRIEEKIAEKEGSAKLYNLKAKLGVL